MPEIGGRLGSAIADLVTDQMVKARSMLMEAEGEHTERRRVALWETLESEIADIIKERGIDAFTDPELSAETRAAFRSLSEPSHQADFLFNIVAFIGMAIQGAFAAAAGYAQQLTQIGMSKHARVVPSPGEAGDLAARGFIDAGTAQLWAKWNGMQGDVFAPVLDSSAREPDAGSLIEMLRRKRIDLGTYQKAMERLGFRPGWSDAFIRSMLGPPDSGMVVSGVTQSQLSADTARELLAENGIDPVHYEWIYKTAGQSPPVDLTINLKRRGLIDDAIFTKIILESPIKNEYVDVIKKMVFQWPPMEQTISMVRRGTYTPEQGADRLAKLGFAPEDIEAMIGWATQDRNETKKDLSTAQIVDLYELKLRDRDATVASLIALGWSAEEADWLLSIADVKIMRRNLDRSVSRVRAAVLAHRIDELAATVALDQIGVAPAARDELLETWATEESVNVAILTQAQLIAAAKKSIIAADECGRRLVLLGYSEEDATILMATAGVIDLSEGGKGA